MVGTGAARDGRSSKLGTTILSDSLNPRDAVDLRYSCTILVWTPDLQCVAKPSRQGPCANHSSSAAVQLQRGRYPCNETSGLHSRLVTHNAATKAVVRPSLIKPSLTSSYRAALVIVSGSVMV